MSQNFISLYKKTTYSEQEIIKGIIEDDDMVIRYLYRKFYPGIKTMVRSFHNFRFDPDDVFQEGLTRAIINIKKGKFQGRSSFYTYLNSICHFICLKELKSVQGIYPVMENIPDDSGSGENDHDSICLLIKIKERMDQGCREIIDVRFGLGIEYELNEELLGHHNNLKFEEIGKILGIEPDNARQRFKRCLEKLREALSRNPEWVESSNSN